MVVESHNTPEDSSVVPQTAPKKKPVRGSHRVMTASGRVPNRLVFGRRIAKNLDPGTSQTHFSPMIAPVVRALRKYHPEEDIQVLQRAFEVANRHHRGQKRKSGDP